MKANVQNVALRGAQRIIAISDVHGNGHLLQRLLEQIRFSTKDALVLLGDHIEKGDGSLYTLRFIKSLCEAGNTYALQGNCDTLWEDLKSGLYGVDLVRYMDWRKQRYVRRAWIGCACMPACGNPLSAGAGVWRSICMACRIAAHH